MPIQMPLYVVRKPVGPSGATGQIQVTVRADDAHTARLQGARELGVDPSVVTVELTSVISEAPGGDARRYYEAKERYEKGTPIVKEQD